MREYLATCDMEESNPTCAIKKYDPYCIIRERKRIRLPDSYGFDEDVYGFDDCSYGYWNEEIIK